MKRATLIISIFFIAGTFIFTDMASADFAKKSSSRTDEKKSSKKKNEKPNFAPLPALEGPRKNIAVMDFDNKAGGYAQWNLGSGMAEMLTTSLVESGRFVVIERQAITDVLAEQDFGASGRTTEAGAAKIGNVLNAQVLIRGAVTEFDMSSSGAGNLLSFAGVDVGLKSSNAHVAVNIRLYDATTGEVLDSIRCEGKASAGGISGGYSGSDLGGLNFGSSAFVKTPLGKATQKVIDQAVYEIIQKMNGVPWEGKIVTIKDDTIYMNAGQNSNVLVGDEFTVYNKGEDLIDPDTGISLGSEDTRVGRVQVFSVEEKFSKANATAGSVSAFKRGDVLRIN